MLYHPAWSVEVNGRMDQTNVGGLATEKKVAWEAHCLCRLFSSSRTPESSSRHWVTPQSGQRAEGLPCPVHSRMSATDCCSPGSTESVAFPLLIVEICYPRITVIQKARHTGHRKGRKCRIGEGDIFSLTAHTLCKPKNFFFLLFFLFLIISNIFI